MFVYPVFKYSSGHFIREKNEECKIKNQISTIRIISAIKV